MRAVAGSRSIMRAEVLWRAFQYLGSQQGPDEYVRYYREREAFWVTKAYALRWWDQQQTAEESEPKVKMVFFGPRLHSSRSYR